MKKVKESVTATLMSRYALIKVVSGVRNEIMIYVQKAVIGFAFQRIRMHVMLSVRPQIRKVLLS